MIIYLAINLINGKVYVGKTTKTLSQRIYEHFKESKRNKIQTIFWRAIRKYGFQNFEFIEIDRAADLEDLNKKEIFWINYHKAFKTFGNYNMTLGADGATPGMRMSPQTEFKPGQKPWNMGKNHSEEHRKNLSKSHLGKTNPKLSIIMKEKSKKGELVPWNKGKFGRKRSRRVACIETGIIFESITLAAKSVGLSHSRIWDVVNNRQDMAGGFHWEYVDKEVQNV